ncbi:hypothetical protein H312_02142 [Anncaliia algerae PRA339]|uniref:N-acetyltransferase domain-containing protein n=1 Tax=Anncaliia algerae PRA339 TaxID=1288291 RepID=A0A059F0F5_9MICR|nr:hypothetical protein H312_02142 [Anncaliia algerae PRA339]
MFYLKKYDSYNQTKELRLFFKKTLTETYNYFLFIELLYKSKDYIFMVTDKTQLIAAVTGMEEHRNTGTIAMLGVLKEYRKHGLAKFLVKLILNSFYNKGITTVYVDTNESNIPALKLYKSIGFVIINYFERYYTDCSPAFRLKIELKEEFDMKNDIYFYLLNN